MYEYTEMRARSIARTHRQSVQRMSRTLTRIAAFLCCPRAMRGVHRGGRVRKRMLATRGKKGGRIERRRSIEKKKGKKKTEEGREKEGRRELGCAVKQSRVRRGRTWTFFSMGVQGLSLPSTPRFNHPTDCLQLCAPKFLLSLFSPFSFSLSPGSFLSVSFPPSFFVVVFMFSLFLSRIDRTSALESTPADTNAFYIGFTRENDAWYFVKTLYFSGVT